MVERLSLEDVNAAFAAPPRLSLDEINGLLGPAGGPAAGAGSDAALGALEAPEPAVAPQQGLLPAMGSAFARGATTDIAGSTLRGVGALAQRGAAPAYEALDELRGLVTAGRFDQARRFISTDPRLSDGDRQSLNAELSDVMEGNLDPSAVAGAGSPLAGPNLNNQARAIAEWEGVPYVERPEDRGNPLLEAARRVEAFGERTMPLDPARERQFPVQFARGLGTMVGSVATGGVTAPLMGAGEAQKRAEDAGATEEEQLDAAIKGLAPGAIDVLPIANLLRPFRRMAPWASTRIRAAIYRGIEGGVIEGTTEGIQQFAQNVIAKTGYAPNQELLDGVLENALVGGAVGKVAGGVSGAGRGPRKAPPPPKIQGEREKAAASPPAPVTQEDIDSPIPTELIQQGRAQVDDALGQQKADVHLRREGMPKVGSRVTVAGASGELVDAGERGVKVRLDDGAMFEATYQELAEAGTTVTPEVVQPEPRPEPVKVREETTEKRDDGTTVKTTVERTEAPDDTQAGQQVRGEEPRRAEEARLLPVPQAGREAARAGGALQEAEAARADEPIRLEPVAPAPAREPIDVEFRDVTPRRLTMAEVDALPAPAPQLTYRPSGEPWRTQAGAELAARAQKRDVVPVPVEGGFALAGRVGAGLPINPQNGRPFTSVRQARSVLANMQVSQKKRLELLADQGKLTAYAADKGISAGEMRDLLVANASTTARAIDAIDGFLSGPSAKSAERSEVARASKIKFTNLKQTESSTAVTPLPAPPAEPVAPAQEATAPVKVPEQVTPSASSTVRAEDFGYEGPRKPRQPKITAATDLDTADRQRATPTLSREQKKAAEEAKARTLRQFGEAERRAKMSPDAAPLREWKARAQEEADKGPLGGATEANRKAYARGFMDGIAKREQQSENKAYSRGHGDGRLWASQNPRPASQEPITVETRTDRGAKTTYELEPDPAAVSEVRERVSKLPSQAFYRRTSADPEPRRWLVRAVMPDGTVQERVVEAPSREDAEQRAFQGKPKRIAAALVPPVSQADALHKELRDLLRRIAGSRVRLDVRKRLVDPQGNPVEGQYLRGVISVALGATDAAGTTRHEAIHFLRETGAIEGATWRMLEKRAAEWRKTYRVDERYEGLTEAELNEEAIAEAYAQWAAGKLPKRGELQVRGVFARVKRILEAIRDALRKLYGGKLPSAEEVFAAIEAGEYADRGGEPGGVTPKMALPAWHGSPHDFDAFDIGKIGTGEGAQAFGHGLYFASRKEIAEHYRDNVKIDRTEYRLNGELWDADDVGLEIGDAITTAAPTFNVDELDNVVLQALTAMSNGESLKDMENFVRRSDWDADVKAGWLAGLGRARQFEVKPASKGRLYEVELAPDDADLLDWDAPLSQQSEKVREGIWDVSKAQMVYERLRTRYADENDLDRFTTKDDRAMRDVFTGNDFYRALGEVLAPSPPSQDEDALGFTPRSDRADRAASRALRDAGIPGIRYKDAGARGSDRESHNYVIFDDSLVTVRAKYQRALNFGRPEAAVEDAVQGVAEAQPDLTDGESSVGSLIDRARIIFQDRFLRVRRVQETVERKLGRPLSLEEQPYLGEELMHGRIGEKKFRVDKEIKEPVIDAMRRGGLTVEQVDEYLTALHAEERNAYVASINDAMPDGGSGMTNAEARAVLRRATPEMREIGDLVRRMMDERLSELVDSGLVSPEDAAIWRSRFPNYIPLRGVPELDGDVPAIMRAMTGRGFMGRRKVEPHIAGRRTRAPDVLGMAFVLADEAIVRGEKNRVAQALARMVEAHPDPRIWEMDPAETKARLVKGKIKYVKNPHYSPKDTVTLRIAGKERRIQINDPALLRALESMNAELGAFIRTMGWITQQLSKLNTTLSPEFIFTNALMDAQTGLVNLGIQDQKGLRREVIGNWRKAFSGALRYTRSGKATDAWTRHAQEFRRNGGHTAFNQQLDVQTRVKDLNKALNELRGGTGLAMLRAGKGLLHAVEDTNNAIDAAMRLSTYVALRNRGVPAMKAASVAKNLTVNFNRRGSAGPSLNAMLMFYNASVQGTAVLAGALKHQKVRRFVYGIAFLGAAQELLAGMIPPPDDDDDDELGLSLYDRVPEWEKTRNIIIPYGTKPGEYVRVRMPYGFNGFHSMGRLIAAYLRGARELDGKSVTMAQTIAKMAGAMSMAVAPAGIDSPVPFTPTVITPWVETMVNENYFGSPVSPERFPGDVRPDSQLYFNSVNPLAKEVAAWLNRLTGGDEFEPGLVDVAPGSVQHVVSTYFGSAGRFVMKSIASLDKSLGELTDTNAETPELGTNDIPFVRVFAGTASSYQAISATYDRLTALEVLEDRYKAADADGRAELRRERGGELALIKEGRKLRRTLSKIRKQRQAILASDATTAEKRAQTDRLTEQQRALMGGFNRRYIRALATAEERQ